MAKIKLSFTLEELLEMKLISNTNGRPPSYLTNEKWQKEFELRKTFLTPHPSNVKSLSSRYCQDNRIVNSEENPYYGATNYQTYCLFINDVIKELRKGNVDYCYFIYQIEELYRFFPNLKTLFIENGRYWQVWLDRAK